MDLGFFLQMNNNNTNSVVYNFGIVCPENVTNRVLREFLNKTEDIQKERRSFWSGKFFAHTLVVSHDESDISFARGLRDLTFDFPTLKWIIGLSLVQKEEKVGKIDVFFTPSQYLQNTHPLKCFFQNSTKMNLWKNEVKMSIEKYNKMAVYEPDIDIPEILELDGISTELKVLNKNSTEFEHYSFIAYYDSEESKGWVAVNLVNLLLHCISLSLQDLPK